MAQSIFAAFALATRFRVKVADRILIVCLLFFALKFLAFSLQEIHGDYLDLEFSTGLIPMTFGPFMFLYTSYLVDRKLKFNPKDLLHFLPFVVLTTCYFLFFKDGLSFNDVAFFNPDRFLFPRLFYGITYFVMVVTYTYFTFKKLNEFRSGLEGQFSFWSQQLKLLWLNYIPLLFSVFFAGYFIAGIINALSFKEVIDISDISQIGLTIIAFLISYFGLRQPSLFQPEYIGFSDINPSEVEEAMQEEEEETEALPAEDDNIKAKIERLENIMSSDKPYLNPMLTLYDLASKLNMKKNDLTFLLNKHVGKNFFTFVNEYRVQEVIQRFQDEQYDNYTILAIALDCGFNSKSTFNTLFKQHTGKTPSAYRKDLKSNN